ncbi:hypothetical protein [Actinophytocola algeriensis]|uniref:Uncharacterized protein n=1 Tax=Actinophytocola algeriensis TaxID=1768010 RepID=A0A7W7PZF8_9PSEU|nr:hypothetical protein [Actinophytocola algeriensis]MBB4904142.1 hypothetical protein [Actinophytocola algeriensis]MBE1477001.1 hypothetical protein [Actinophytocola algeriensis]
MVATAAVALLAGTVTANAEPAGAGRDGVLAEPLQSAAARGDARAADDPLGSYFVPVSPVRVLDTRSGAKVGQRGQVTVDLSARTPASATAVVLNVTGTETTASTFITAYPTGEARPEASNLNLGAGKTRANAVVVATSYERQVTLYNNSGSTHLVADLAGYYMLDTASRFTPTAPRRVLDTRNSAPVGQGGVVNVNLSYLPASATAVTFNLTGVGATASTYVTAYPYGQARPTASNMNLSPNEVVPNQVTVQLGTNRWISLYNNTGRTHLIVDVAGYYASDRGYQFVPTIPFRQMDTRPDFPLDPSFFLALPGWDSESASMTIVGVAANLTGVGATSSTYVKVWPGGQDEPPTSNLNVVPGQVVANAVTVGIGYEDHPQIQDRTVNFANNSGYVDVIFDVAGLFVQYNA